MIVCSCNALSDRAIRGVVDETGGCGRMSEVFDSLGCRPQCGRCAPTVKQIIREAADRDGDTCPAVIDDFPGAQVDGGADWQVAAE